MEMKCDKKHIKQRSCHFEHDFHSRTFFVPLETIFVSLVRIFIPLVTLFANILCSISNIFQEQQEEQQ